MNLDRCLIESIKVHFSRKSTAQLHDIVDSNDQEQWSLEASSAAQEILNDRLDGRAKEPLEPEVERLPPPVRVDAFGVSLLAFGALAGIALGYIVVPVYRPDYTGSLEADPDLPVPFCPEMAWLALDTTDTQGVAAALGLLNARAGTWKEGLAAAAAEGCLFVTPPLAEWTLVVGVTLFPKDVHMSVRPLLEQLSRQFGDAQFFCTHQEANLLIWARARRGQFTRGFGRLGQNCSTVWDEGRLTKEERDLGLPFIDANSNSAEKSPLRLPDESNVLELASLWSIDPTCLDEQFKKPTTGLVGKPAWVKEECVAAFARIKQEGIPASA
jgi:hypothetical protein